MILTECPVCHAAAQVTLPNTIAHANCGHEDDIIAWMTSVAGRRWLAEYLLASDVQEWLPCARAA